MAGAGGASPGALEAGFAAAAEPTSPTGGSQLIDTKAIGKLRAFDGKEESWPTWSFVARSYFRLLDQELGEYIQRAESTARHTEIVLSEMGARATERAVVLFNLLTQCVDNRALQVMMNVEPGNGFQAWKALCETYEPSVGGRHTAIDGNHRPIMGERA